MPWMATRIAVLPDVAALLSCDCNVPRANPAIEAGDAIPHGCDCVLDPDSIDQSGPVPLVLAEAIPGAELVVIDGMGHDLPRALWPEITARIADLVGRAERAPARAHDGRLRRSS